MDSLTRGIDTLIAIAIVATLAPFLAAAVPGKRVPQVVILIIGGIIIGPQVLGLAETASVELFANVGLGFVFLFAGYELDPLLFRARYGRNAVLAWVIAAVLALAVVGILEAAGLVHAFVPVSIALTTTGLGTLLPILRDNDMLSGEFGKYIVAAGATGEFLPIVAVAIFLGTTSSVAAIVSLLMIGGLAAVFALAPRLIHSTTITRILIAGEHATSQTTLRLTVLLLLVLLGFAARFGLDIVLGAFIAGLVLRRWAPGHVHSLEEKLDAVGYGFFIPIFFVSSGMALDIDSIAAAPLRLLAFFLLLLVIRGLPALLVYRRTLNTTQRRQMVFITATTLPMLVALAHIGLANGTMLPENAAALVGAGVLSVLVFPAVAVAIGSHTRPQPAPAKPG
ncbi:potassium transporter Kef [Rhizocola hellebori]|uniref:Potassium transporter Kef n=1 Tax=Rhizocola hellebori TaxID=1392758 RepID=A0A8J3VEJ4_9ACTN|nr:cation:proton antiporter [Rhizocola hellebori]GIH03610.1 potassium transporter Kef [Rhizocola hellebori]